MTILETVTKIKNLEIQGAEKIAIAAVQAFGELLKTTNDRKALEKAVQELSMARATEPTLRNALSFCLANYEKNQNVADDVVKHFETSKEKIIKFGAEKIQNGMTVFTHCHSGTVTGILIRAWQEGRRFTVYQTETRPRYQGRITAKELAEAGIPVTHGVDSAGNGLLQKADMFMFGADSVNSSGNVINKIGTLTFAEIANLKKIPVYACTNSWKFNPEEEQIEQRDPKEVWDSAPSGVKIVNPAFEITPAGLITGIITELGIMKPEALIPEIKKAYPWMVI